jgi:hypothetical protein
MPKSGGGVEKAQFQALTENFREFSESLSRESHALGSRLGKVESFLGHQEVPFEKVFELINKSEETVQLQVRRELGLQMRKMMETMMGEMLQERIRNSEREGHMEKIGVEIENQLKGQVAALLQKQCQDLQNEQKERKKLQQQLTLWQNQVLEGVLKNQQEKTAENLELAEKKKSVVRQPENLGDDLLRLETASEYVSDFCDLLVLEGFEPEAAKTQVRQISVRPVGAVPATPMMSASNPMLQQILRNTEPPKFSGQSRDWTQFVLDWGDYYRKASTGQNVTDSMKLEFFIAALDDVNKNEVKLRHLETSGKLTFSEEFDRIDAKYARDQPICMRKKWQEVSMVTQGKITAREWQEFVVNFKSARRQVTDSTEEEARRLLLQKLPPFIFNWVTEEQERRTTHNPRMKITVPRVTNGGRVITAKIVSDSVQGFINEKPSRVSKINEEEYEVVLENILSCEKLKNLSGKTFAGTDKKMKVSQIEVLISLEEIFLLVGQKLTLRDRQDMEQNSRGRVYNNFGNRRTRSASADRVREGSRKTSPARPEKNSETVTEIPKKTDPPVRSTTPPRSVNTQPVPPVVPPPAPPQIQLNSPPGQKGGGRVGRTMPGIRIKGVGETILGIPIDFHHGMGMTGMDNDGMGTFLSSMEQGGGIPATRKDLARMASLGKVKKEKAKAGAGGIKAREARIVPGWGGDPLA